MYSVEYSVPESAVIAIQHTRALTHTNHTAAKQISEDKLAAHTVNVTNLPHALSNTDPRPQKPNARRTVGTTCTHDADPLPVKRTAYSVRCANICGGCLSVRAPPFYTEALCEIKG